MSIAFGPSCESLGNHVVLLSFAKVEGIPLRALWGTVGTLGALGGRLEALGTPWAASGGQQQAVRLTESSHWQVTEVPLSHHQVTEPTRSSNHDSLGTLGDTLGSYWAHFGVSPWPVGVHLGPFGVSWGCLGGLLVSLWVALGAIWGVLGVKLCALGFSFGAFEVTCQSHSAHHAKA